MKLLIAFASYMLLLPKISTLACEMLGVSTQSNKAGEVKRLLLVLKNESMKSNDPETLAKAIFRLGDLKSVEAIDDLIKLLTFKHTYSWEIAAGGRLEAQPVTTFERYPAIVALFAIGKAVLPSVIKVIETHESSSLEAQNAALVVELVFRENPAEGVRYLKEASAKASAPEASQRLLFAANRKRLLQK